MEILTQKEQFALRCAAPKVHGYLHPDEIASYFDPRELISSGDVLRLIPDVRRNGVQQPVRLSTDGERVRVMDGHHRTRAAQRVGLESVPVHVRRSRVPIGPEYGKITDGLRDIVGGRQQLAYGDTEQMQDVTDISPGGPANPDGPSDMVSEPRWDMMSDE